MKKVLAMLLVLTLLLSGCGDGVTCRGLKVSDSAVTLTRAGQTRGLEVTKNPEDAVERVEFYSSDESVATVSRQGLITAVGPGTTTITISCGDVTKFCEVTCSFDTNGGSRPEQADLTTESVCPDCGGKGLCPDCGGEPWCPECNGTPECQSCKNSPGECIMCEGEGGHTCFYCRGDWECDQCGGDGDCFKCGGDGDCVECGGDAQMSCNKCDASGDCYHCGGDGVRSGRDCAICKGDGDCYVCEGDGERECIYCEYKPGKCYECYGDGDCGECYGDGSICNMCDKYGWEDCTYCDDGKCGVCDGEPVCKACGGEGVICRNCDEGKCRTCGGKNAPQSPTGNNNDQPTPVTPDKNDDSWIPEGHTRCYTCGGDMLNHCSTCGGIGGCPNDDCILGKVDCSKCDGTGDCPTCGGLKENIVTGRKCSACNGRGKCSKCNGQEEFTCNTCGGDGKCPTCDDATWCTTCGGNGYI